MSGLAAELGVDINSLEFVGSSVVVRDAIAVQNDENALIGDCYATLLDREHLAAESADRLQAARDYDKLNDSSTDAIDTFIEDGQRDVQAR